MATVDSVQNRINFASWRFIGIACMVLLSALAGAYLGFHNSVADDVILSGVQVAGIPVGGMQAGEAERYLAEKLRAKVERPIYVRWENGDDFVYPADIGISADTEKMVQQALAAGRKGSILQQLRDRYRIRGRGYNVPLQTKGSGKLDAFLQTFRKKIDRPPVNAGFKLEAHDKVSLVPGQSGLVVDVDKMRHDLLVAATQLDREIVAPLHVQEPEITTAELRAWEITSVVARYSTSFSSADANRTHNLRIAVNALNGAVIPPGKTFSFNEQVGPRALSTGYKEAPVVVDGELVPDIGGGVCQVSSTLFNAVALAGLRIDSRQSHSIPSTYVPLGQDATVAYNYIDFRFTNSTQQYLYVKAWIEGNKVHVTLLGAKPAPAARIVSKVEEVLPFTVQELKDPTLPAGKRVVDREGGKGYKVSIWRVTGPKGAEKWEMIGRSNYKPRAQITRVGTGAYDRAGSAGSRHSASARSASAMLASRSSQG